jgi:FlaA1/EpsC-like NDP-sugar epimerase
LNKFISRTAIIIMHDLGMAAVAWLLAWCVRFNFYFHFPDWYLSFYTLPTVLIVQGLVLWMFGLYRGMWRFASVSDLWNIFRSALVGVFGIMIVLFFMIRLEGIPRSIFALYPVFLIFLLGAPRLIYRLWKDNSYTFKPVTTGNKVIIIGAGRAGEMLARDMLRNDNYTPVGFLDDDPKVKKSELHGVPVLGAIEILPQVAGQYSDIELIVIATPSATNEEMQQIVEVCEQVNVPIRTLPNLNEMSSFTPAESELQELSIEDLLGRDKVELDWDSIQKGISGKVVLITGGGGSIGSELCRQVAELMPKVLVIYEQGEFNLYKIQASLNKKYPDLSLQVILGDICDRDKVNFVFQQFKPDVVFHAAAYKHVPILELEKREAVRNNIIGTVSIAEAADRFKCNKFVFISTDKAVNPANILGKSKRVAEIYCDGMNQRSNTQFITVRFGNVLGSDGSVVPLFQKQIKDGGPITLTHPEITRYFMTIREASQLILQAGAMGKGGEIFVLDMGQPVKISYLAEQMVKLSGLVIGEDVQIEYIGLRPGEKLYEELFYDNEKQENTGHEKILLAKHSSVAWQYLTDSLKELGNACDGFDDEKLIFILDQLMPNNGHINDKHKGVVQFQQNL